MQPNTVPVIDISSYFDGSLADKQKVAREVGRACEEIGFLTIVGHGVSPQLIRDVNSTAKQFFDLPLEQKKDGQTTTYGMGYLPVESESLAASLEMNAAGDLKESLNLGLNYEQERWPNVPPELRPICLEYFAVLEKLSAAIMRIFALALDLPEQFFDDKIDHAGVILRLLNYPAIDRAVKPGQLRASAHTDYGTLTVLWSETISGLQARHRNGEWVNVTAVPESFVVNIGDLMMRWTNDRWISTLHRVVAPEGQVIKASRRQSLDFFHNPNPDTIVSCLESCCDAEHPAKYPPINATEHLMNKSSKSRSAADKEN